MATKQQNDNNKLIIETALNVKNMGERLFGGPGQPDGGALHFIMNQHKELAAKIEANRQELADKTEISKQELVDKIDVNKQELLDRIETKKAETDTAVEKVSTDQQELETKVNRVITAGITVNTIAGLFLAWLGVHHHG